MAKIPINIKSGKIEESEQELIIGIDLGTTNSLVAYVEKASIQVVKDEDGKNSLVPSIVHFSEQGNIVVGQTAQSQLVQSPQRTVYSVKRLIGKSYGDVQNYADHLSYHIIDQEDEMVKVRIDDNFYSPVNLSAEILKYLKSRVENSLNRPVSKAVITVPAYFNDLQRQATRDAGKLAGLDVLRIVNEPTAAALAYGFGKTDTQSENVAVYDLGGGTFDISILRIDNGIFDVLSTCGDTFLGGDDLDQAIISFWIEKYGLDGGMTDKSLIQSIRLKAEEAKKSLSYNDVYISEDGLFQISKTEFENLIAPLLNKTFELVDQAIKDSGLNLDKINKFVLVGGSTRIPLIAQSIIQRYKVDVMNNLDPDEVVAMGAAVQADILAGNSPEYLLIDVTPLSLGIETMGGLMDVIIPRNSKVPISAGRKYTTSVDGQKNLKISIYQGERELVEHNRKLGEFILSGIPPMAAGMPKIEVQFIIDADGILKVRALELRSNTVQEIKIMSQYGIEEEEMGRMLLDSIQNAESDMKIKALLEAKNEASAVMLATDKFIDQNAQWMSDDDKNKLIELRSILSDQSHSGSKDSIHAAMENLNEYARPLAEKALNLNIKKALSGKKL